MSFHRRTTAAVAIAFFGISTGAANGVAQAASPSFAGTWVLDTTKSTGIQGLSSLKLTVVQHGDTLTLDSESQSVMGASKSHSTIGLDGKPWKNTLNAAGNAIEMTSVGKRGTGTIIIDATGQIQTYQLSQHDEWSLDSTGNTLTVNRTTDVATQHNVAALVFTRQ